MSSAWIFGLASWLPWRRDVPVRQLQLVLYTRQGCHLCESACRQLHAAASRYRLSLQVVDVDAEPGLAAQYGRSVPVVMVNGKIRFRGGINPILLDRLLHAEKEKQPER
jgi:glutaredoxin